MAISALTVPAGAALALCVYLAAIVFYRLTLHPLAKYPGPFLARITQWYDAYHCWKGDRHLDQWRCHQLYGPVVRYSPNHMIINTASALQDICGGSKNGNLQKAQHYKFLHQGPDSSSATTIDKDVHAHKRRVLSQGFSDHVLKALEVFMIDNIDRWCKLLGQKNDEKSTWTEPIDMAKSANYLTLDVLGDLAFGKPFGLLRHDTNRFLPGIMMSAMERWQIVGHSPLLPFWKYISMLRLDRLISPVDSNSAKRYLEFVKQAVEERVEFSEREGKETGENARKDFYYWLRRAKDPQTGESYTMPEMWVETRTLVTAGSDTSSITLAATFFYLTRNPRVLAKLQNELRTVFSTVDQIKMGPQLNTCHYLRSVIDETLRMAPPLPSDSAREILSGGSEVDGQHFPEGTVIGTSAYALHHNEDYFEDPWIYRPERWIVDDKHAVAAESVATARAAFCPFSLGSRGCIGKPMAYAEISIALGRALYLYDVKPKDGDATGAGNPALEWGRRREDEYQLHDRFICSREGPLVQSKEYS